MNLRIQDGELLVEPDLPPLTLCGGLQAPYLPLVPTPELERVSGNPTLSPSWVSAVAGELAQRRTRGGWSP